VDRIELNADGFAFRFSEFSALRSRTGVVVGLGAGVSL
jgi:hypothetical protein